MKPCHCCGGWLSDDAEEACGVCEECQANCCAPLGEMDNICAEACPEGKRRLANYKPGEYECPGF